MQETGNRSTSKEPVLELRQITKSYPGVIALDGVNLAIYPSEIVGLVGENGAGKSTLMKILIGNVQPDQGSYRIRGQAVRLRDPAHAIRLGVGLVFQEGSLIPNLSIMENLFLCHETEFERFGVLSKREMREAARTALATVKVAEDLDTPVAEATPAVRQMVEIARLLWLSRIYHQQNPVLILDEPTTVLTEQERETLFSILHEITNQASIILISHRLQEIVENSDRIVVLKDGKNVTDFSSENASIPEIEHLMVGHTFSADRYRENEQTEPSEKVVIRVDNLSKKHKFDPINFTVGEGEILSLVGLVGSGKEALCACLTGLEKPDSGSVTIAGKRVLAGLPSEAVRSGIGHVPVDRRNEGLALGMTVADNLNLLVLDRLKTVRLMSPVREKRNALDWIKECRIKTPSPATLCANLSGGNQQKVVIAKWLTSQVRFLVLDHPTRGVDVGAKEEIYRLIRKLASDGVGMIVMCDTLEEDIGLCSRMLIMKDGRLVREIPCPPFQKPSPSEIIGSIV
jgi:ribose transport system ATP-binding protein